jgi:hypothetical protein
LAFSYWIDYLGFITEGKLAAIFIKPSLGVSNWLVIYYTFPRQLGNRSFLSLLPRLKKKLPNHHHRAITVQGQNQPSQGNDNEGGYIPSKGHITAMIQPVPKSNKEEKSISHQVNLAVTLPPVTTEYLH